jgi:hypothetical protein
MLRYVADPLRQKWPKLATDEIDKPFSAGSLESMGVGRALERAGQPFCSSKARWPRGLLGCGFDNAASRRRRGPQASVYKAASQQRQSAMALEGLLCSKPKSLDRVLRSGRNLVRVVSSACTADRVAKSKGRG